jgi:predicted AlkP superfamily phosphohydrolase/phosphomutase
MLPALTAVLAAFLGVAGCRARSADHGRVLVLGLDGMEPTVVDLLMAEGKLPHFAKIRQEGAYGRLTSAHPLLSPVVWTTIATGKTPDEHHIGHFVAINQKSGEPLPVTSRMRRVKALWNILSDSGRSVAVVGWWASWPAETVRGSIVSDHLCYHFLMEPEAEAAKGAKGAGLTYPPELAATLAGKVERPSDLKREDLAPFVTVDDADLARAFDFEDDLSHFKWALATAHTYSRIGLDLWKEQKPDLGMVYIEGTDSTSHLFGHLFRAQGLSGELAHQQEKFGRAVEQMYIYADQILGRFLESMDSRTTLIVLSDHGFQLGALPDDPSKTRDMRRVSERYHTMQGILYLYGRGVKGRTRLEEPTIQDVAPTILTLVGLAPAVDMKGRVLTEALESAPLPAVPTYETGGSGSGDGSLTDASVDPQILEKLRSLGYLQATSPTGDRNLAAVLFESGRYAEAEKAYAKLVADKPADGALRTSYAGALGALGRYDDAMKQIDQAIRLEPLNPEAYHNRAVIHERRGEREAAIADYRAALRYNPGYEPSRASLERLGVPPVATTDSGPQERAARVLAEEASGAARRGDYKVAMRKLDEAERLAPRLSLLYQYRSNVAYLMGDRAAAIAALQKGLALEPDNALFRENLKQLQKAPPK